MLGSVDGGKVTLIAGVTADLTGKVKAGELVNHVAQQVGGKGGGRPDMAQAGGTQSGSAARGAAIGAGVGRAAAVNGRHGSRRMPAMPLRPDATLDEFVNRGAGRLPGLVGVRFMAVAENRIDAELEIRPELLAPNGYLHAATVIALADTACGYGCLAHLPAGAENFTTIELKSNFLGTAREGVIACVATPAHLGQYHAGLGCRRHRARRRARRIALFRCTQIGPLAQENGLTRMHAYVYRMDGRHVTVCSGSITSNRSAITPGGAEPICSSCARDRPAEPIGSGLSL